MAEMTELKSPDTVLSLLQKGADLMVKNLKILAVLALLAVLVLAAYGIFSHYSKKEDQTQRSQFYTMKRDLYNSVERIQADLRPKPASLEKKVSSSEPDTQSLPTVRFDIDKALEVQLAPLKIFAKTDGKSLKRYEAAMLLGDLYWQYHVDLNRALDWYDIAVRQATSPLETSMALYSMAYCLEALNKPDDAIKNFRSLLGIPKLLPTMKSDAFFGIARIFQSQKKLEEARGAYDEITKQFPGSELSQRALLLKAQL